MTSCLNVATTPEQAANTFKCPVNLGEVESLRLIGLILSGLISPSTDPNAPAGSLITNTNSKDAGPAWETLRGNDSDGNIFNSTDASTSQWMVSRAPAAGEKLVVTDIIVSVNADMRVDFYWQDNASIAQTLFMLKGQSIQITPRSKWKCNDADKSFLVRTSVSGEICVNVFAYSEK